MRKGILWSTLGGITAAMLAPLMLFAQSGAGDDYLCRIVKLEGKVEVYAPAGQKQEAGATMAKYNGHEYGVFKGNVGRKVAHGSVIRTDKDGKVRLIYKNGDQMNIGPATMFEVEQKLVDTKDVDSNGQKTPVVSLLFGSVRSIISKEGPRNNMKVKTRTAAMGVRGTDFHVSIGGEKGLNVSVLRGSVDLAPNAPAPAPAPVPVAVAPKLDKKATANSAPVAPAPVAPAPAPIKIEAGSSATIAQEVLEKLEAPLAKPMVEKLPASDVKGGADQVAPPIQEVAAIAFPQIKIEKMNQGQLIEIQKDSAIKLDAKQEAEMLSTIKPEEKKELEKLEKQAVDTTLTDIKHYDEKLYNEIIQNKGAGKDFVDIAIVNAAVVKEAYKEAPPAPVALVKRSPSSRPAKPSEGDLKDINNLYDQYFQSEE